MDYKKFLDNPNTQKYLKNYLKSADAANYKLNGLKELNEKVDKTKSKNADNKIMDSFDDEKGYDIDDIIKEKPSTSVVRDFFKFQVENICDEEDLLFSK